MPSLPLLKKIRNFIQVGALILLMSGPPSDIFRVVDGKSTINQCSPTSGCYDIQTQFDWYEYEGKKNYPNKSTNCGPASVSMAIRFATGGKISPTSEEVRKHTGANPGRLITMAQLEKALDHYKVKHTRLGSFDEIKKAIIDRHHPVIVLAKMSEMTSGSDFVPVNYINYDGTCPEDHLCYGATTKRGDITVVQTY